MSVGLMCLYSTISNRMKNWFTNVLISAAVLQLAGGIISAAYILIENGELVLSFEGLTRLATCAIYAGVAVVLLSVDRSIPSKHLAACFLLIAISYSTSFVRLLADVASSLAADSLLADYLLFTVRASIEVFLAFQAWSYIRSHFNSSVEVHWIDRATYSMRYVSLGIGIFLVAINVLPVTNIPISLQQFLRVGDLSRFHLWAYLPLLPFFPVVVAMCFYTSAQELKKVAVLVLGIGFTVPALLVIFVYGLNAKFGVIVEQPVAAAFTVTTGNLVLMFSPLTIAYAAIVLGRNQDEASQSNLVIYRIALVLVYSFMLVPMVGIVSFYGALGEIELNALFEDPRAYLLVMCLFGLIWLYSFRRKLIENITSLFYRREYDGKAVYSEISDVAHAAENIPELLKQVTAIIDQALNSKKISSYTNDPYRRRMQPLFETGESLDLSEADYQSISQVRGSLLDLQILGDTKVVLVIRTLSNEVLVCVLLSGKKNGDEYDEGDRELLLSVQNMLGSVVSKMVKDVNNPSHDFLVPFEAARECPSCQNLFTPQQERCPQCEKILDLASIPYLLNDKYHLVSRLGMGEFGQVYLGTDKTLARKVAIKSLPEAASVLEREFLEREAKMMAKVSHPNLAIVYGIEIWRRRPLLIVEYLPGGTLADRLQDSFNKFNAAEVVKSLCSAVDHTHREGVLHLDIKPSNIGFSKRMDIKLLDFGTAHLLKSIIDKPSLSSQGAQYTMVEAKRTSVSGSMMGTPIYMSPEAHNCYPPHESFDLWSLTVVIIELLTGAHPFVRDTWGETHMSIVKGSAKLPTWLKPELRELIAERMLSSDPNQRPGSALEIGELFANEWDFDARPA